MPPELSQTGVFPPEDTNFLIFSVDTHDTESYWYDPVSLIGETKAQPQYRLPPLPIRQECQ